MCVSSVCCACVCVFRKREGEREKLRCCVCVSTVLSVCVFSAVCASLTFTLGVEEKYRDAAGRMQGFSDVQELLSGGQGT